MASTTNGGSLPPNFLLTPQQQSLLFAALNSNRQGTISPANQALSLSPDSFKKSPAQNMDNAGYQESPELDNYDYDFGDSSFDFSFAGNDQTDQDNMIGDIPDTTKSESTDNDGNEKRSHPDEEDDDDELTEKDPKRRESSDKIPKKPGRKPLTSEPSSKRKAQNRAAQRAFRERKEKHLKDLETKVEELEKASESANHENSMLRAQVERMTTELLQYKQKIAVMSDTKPVSKEKRFFGQPALNNLNDVNFQFEFPKFGVLPGPAASSKQQRPSSQSVNSQPNSRGQTPGTKGSETGSPLSVHQPTQSTAQFNDGLAKFSSMFTPSMNTSTASASRASLDSANFSNFAGNTSSPSASSNSNAGPSSSCGTSPEPFTQSPAGFKPAETMTTIGEEQPSLPSGDQPFAHFSNVDLGSLNFDWVAQQNGGQFDPQLFGDYREPQDNILANPTFDDLFNDSLDADFFTPYNMAPSPNGQKAPNLIDAIDAKQSAVEDDSPKNITCSEVWDKLQACPKAQNGEFDLDGLCSELTKKAKCSGSGPVVAELDFDTILKKYMGKDVSSQCVANNLGIELERSPQPSNTNHTELGLGPV